MVAVILAASDPEWLPSTIVQSSAALVAIVGGLLVARLVSMASERGGLVQRLAELDDQLETARTHLHDLVTRRAGWDLGDFVDSAADLYYEEGITSVDALVDRVPHGATVEERRQFAEVFLAWVARNEPPIRELHAGEAQTRSVDDLRAAGFEVDPMFESVAETLLRALTPRRSSRLGIDLDMVIPSFTVDEAGRTVTLQRWDTLLRDIEAAERRVAELSHAHVQVQARLSALTPQGVTGTLVALGGVVVAGIAFPIVVMAMRWPDLTAPWRWALVGAFLISVAGVGVYIYRLAQSLVSD